MATTAACDAWYSRCAMSVIQVKVKTNARQSALSQLADGSFRAEIKAQPVDGKANAELIALIAQHFGCARSAVTIKLGASSTLKLVKIAAD
jgi:uncharacterized protein